MGSAGFEDDVLVKLDVVGLTALSGPEAGRFKTLLHEGVEAPAADAASAQGNVRGDAEHGHWRGRVGPGEQHADVARQ